jgi:hypothetical protein
MVLQTGTNGKWKKNNNLSLVCLLAKKEFGFRYIPHRAKYLTQFKRILILKEKKEVNFINGQYLKEKNNNKKLTQFIFVEEFKGCIHQHLQCINS